MKTTIVICLISFLFLTPRVRCADGKEDVKMMDGTWLIASAEFAGNKFPDEAIKTMKLILKDDKYTLKTAQGTDEGTVKIDPAKTPKEVDVTGTEGPNKGKTFLAIYELTKDGLKVCYDLSGKTRPTEFKTKPDTMLFLATYTREKP